MLRPWPVPVPGDTVLAWLLGTPPLGMSNASATSLVVQSVTVFSVDAGGYTFALEDLTPTARPGTWKAK